LLLSKGLISKLKDFKEDKEVENDNTWNDFNYLYFVELVYNDNVCDFT
jgi:hypothetical protein